MINLTINDQPVEVPREPPFSKQPRSWASPSPPCATTTPSSPTAAAASAWWKSTSGPRTQLTTACTYPVAEARGPHRHRGGPGRAPLRHGPAPVPLPRSAGAGRKWPGSWVCEAESSRQGESDCILCGKCVRICHELQHVGAIGLTGRGAKRQITTPFGEISQICRTCGACPLSAPPGILRTSARSAAEPPSQALRVQRRTEHPGQRL